MIHPRSILLFGKPGSGKGTQGKIMDSVPGFWHVSAGRFLRQYSQEENEFGEWMRSYLDRGELLPDKTVSELLQRYLADHLSTAGYNPEKDYVIWDGIPRSMTQFHFLTEKSREIHLVYLQFKDDEELLARILKRAKEQNRKDDTEEVFRERMDIFYRESMPVVQQFSNQNQYLVDASDSILQVHAGVVKSILKIVHKNEEKPHG